MSLVITYLANRPDNYEQLEKDLREKAAIGFEKCPEAQIFAGWNGLNWVISGHPKDFWERYVLGIDNPKK